MGRSAVMGIVAALPIEARCLNKQKLVVGQTISLADNMLLHVAGIGGERAQAAALHLIECRANALVSWGTAGGLAPSVQPGQLLLPNQIIDQHNRVFPVDIAWRNQLQANLPGLLIHTDPILQANQLVATVADKKQLYAQYQAVAVDMESAAVAAVAQQAGLPFIAVRSIVDADNFALPAWLQTCLNSSGAVQILPLIKNLCRNPLRLRTLLHLSRAFTLAQSTLVRAGKVLFYSRPTPIAPTPLYHEREILVTTPY